MTDGMKTGALVMLDALGFKGIWKRHDQAKVIPKLQGLRTKVERFNEEIRAKVAAFDEPEETGRVFKTLAIHAKFLSDTIVLGVSCDVPPTRNTNELLLEIGSYLTSHALAFALQEPPALAFRGSIAVGEFLIDDNFILGPAVDDAAAHMDLAEGAFVWMAPSARTAKRKSRGGGDDRYFSAFRVPLKGGSSYHTHVIAPFAECETEAARRSVIRQLLATFVDGNMNIEIKKQHTAQFLDLVMTRLRMWERSRKSKQKKAAEAPGAPQTTEAPESSS
jgi:hypothetical protein